MVQGTIKAGVLNSGYQTISFSTGKSMMTDSTLSFITQGADDDPRNFYGQLNNSTITIRASASNVNDLKFFAIAFCV